jgi:hypothetical protein
MVGRYAAHQFVQSICYLEPAPIYPVHGDRADSVVGYPVLADRGLYCRMHRRIPTCSAWRAVRLFLAHSDFICCSDLLELDGSIRSSSRWRTRRIWRSPNGQWRKSVQCRTGVSKGFLEGGLAVKFLLSLVVTVSICTFIFFSPTIFCHGGGAGGNCGEGYMASIPIALLLSPFIFAAAVFLV